MTLMLGIRQWGSAKLLQSQKTATVTLTLDRFDRVHKTGSKQGVGFKNVSPIWSHIIKTKLKISRRFRTQRPWFGSWNFSACFRLSWPSNRPHGQALLALFHQDSAM